jgi:hypothetical protein
MKIQRQMVSHMAKTWLIQNSRGKKKGFWIMKNLYNSKFIKLYNLLKKLVMLLSVLYEVTCHDITVTNYNFTCCSVVINVIFNTCFSSIICYIHKVYFKGFFKLLSWVIWQKFTNISEMLTTSIITNSPHDGSSEHLWNTGKLLPDHMA